MKLNFSFDSIENINRNIYFFDDKLFRQNSEKQKNKQMSLLNAFQQNFNAKGSSQKFELSGIFGSNALTDSNGKKSKDSDEEIQDPIFLKTWDLLLTSKRKKYLEIILTIKGFDEECNRMFPQENEEEFDKN